MLHAQEFEAIKSEWMQFLSGQDSVADEVRAEMEKFEALCLDEEYKVRACVGACVCVVVP